MFLSEGRTFSRPGPGSDYQPGEGTAEEVRMKRSGLGLREGPSACRSEIEPGWPRAFAAVEVAWSEGDAIARGGPLL